MKLIWFKIPLLTQLQSISKFFHFKKMHLLDGISLLHKWKIARRIIGCRCVHLVNVLEHVSLVLHGVGKCEVMINVQSLACRYLLNECCKLEE